MRILLAVKHFDFGGAENHVRELANALVSQGHRVWVAAPGGRQADLLHPDVTHVPVRFTDGAHPWLALRLASLVRRERIAVVHAHQRLPTLTALLAGTLTGCPVIATLHGQLQHDLTRWPAAAQLLDRLVVVSPFFEDLVARHEPELARKTVYIPNGVRGVATGAAREDGRVVAVWAARIIPRLDGFIADLTGAAADVAARFPSFVLHVAGDGPSAHRLAVLAREANRAAGREVVRPLGYVPDLPATLADASLVLGVGRVVLEALAQGVPALAVNQRYLGPVVSRERFAGLAALNFVPQHAPRPTREGLSRAIGEALAERGRWTADARAVRPTVLGEYGVDAVAARVAAEYEALAGAAAGVRPRPVAAAHPAASPTG